MEYFQRGNATLRSLDRQIIMDRWNQKEIGRNEVSGGSFGEYDTLNTYVKYITSLLYHDMQDYRSNLFSCFVNALKFCIPFATGYKKAILLS